LNFVKSVFITTKFDMYNEVIFQTLRCNEVWQYIEISACQTSLIYISTEEEEKKASTYIYSQVSFLSYLIFVDNDFSACSLCLLSWPNYYTLMYIISHIFRYGSSIPKKSRIHSFHSTQIYCSSIRIQKIRNRKRTCW
jgi:hypothetical protein